MHAYYECMIYMVCMHIMHYISCVHIMHAYREWTKCMHIMRAWYACMICMHSMRAYQHAYYACILCMHNMPTAQRIDRKVCCPHCGVSRIVFCISKIRRRARNAIRSRKDILPISLTSDCVSSLPSTARKHTYIPYHTTPYHAMPCHACMRARTYLRMYAMNVSGECALNVGYVMLCRVVLCYAMFCACMLCVLHECVYYVRMYVRACMRARVRVYAMNVCSGFVQRM